MPTILLLFCPCTFLKLRTDLDLLCSLADGWQRNITNALVDANNQLFTTGSYAGSGGTVHIQDMLKNGVFADADAVPVLNLRGTSIADLTEYLYQLLSATLVNMFWREMNTYIVCYPMTQDECRPG
jgi:hypothetical protein